MGLARTILDKLFRHEEINGGKRCPTYLHRWTLLATPWWKIYLHHFIGDDWSRDLHDHPKRFVSIGLAGQYVEQTAAGLTRWISPWVRSFPATHAHRITVDPGKDCWTLVWVGRAEREWGFYYDLGPGTGRALWVPWQRYIRSAPDSRLSCQ